MGKRLCQCGASVPASADWCDLCLVPLGAEPARPSSEAASRFGSGVHEQIDWARVRRTTLLDPTVTTFGWRGKLVLTSPPYLVLTYFALMLFGSPMFAFGLGIPMLGGCVWWTRQVWRPGFADRQ